MANVNKPKGFELTDTEGKQVRVKAYTNSGNDEIGIGDPVAATADGTVELFDAADATGLLGVSMEYKASGDTSEILICDDPQATYEVMASFDFQLTDIFQNVDVVNGAESNLLSTASVNAPAATAALPFKIVGFVPRQENEVGSFARIYVKPNMTVFTNGVTGI